ncbi:hypothetical protein M0805_005702 [Coniferiporia weirii]|nr:hypothetical protein M0805_005702 [Coniferiporia weirii]
MSSVATSDSKALPHTSLFDIAEWVLGHKPRTAAELDAVKARLVRDPALWSSWAHERKTADIAPPEPVRGWPTPLVTQENVDMYFPALYARGWFVEYISQDKVATAEDGSSFNVPTRTAALGVNLRFRLLTGGEAGSAEKALEAMVAELEERENHHVRKRLSESSPTCYTIVTHTHSAVLPISPNPATANAEPAPTDSKTTSKSGRKVKGTRMPGITLRDVRFALLLDAMCTERFGGSNKGEFTLENVMYTKPSEGGLVQDRPLDVRELLSQETQDKDELRI